MIYGVADTGFTISDMDRALRFYTSVLPFVLETDEDVWGEAVEAATGVFGARLRRVTLRLGDERIVLTQYIAPPGGRPIPADSRSNDHWFQHIAIVVTDMDTAYSHLHAAGVQHVSTAPQTLPETIPAAAGVRAFYFRDPDGHNLELIWFPAGKGDPRWQRATALFAGIDHTAIAVGSTDASLRFYRNALGLAVAGESENFGQEQAHLNMVAGAHLHITGLRAASEHNNANSNSMGIEFLEYLAPMGGRAMPADTAANDLWHWETTLITNNLAAVAAAAVAAGGRAAPQAYSAPASNFRLIQDPDGHVLRLVEH